MRRWFVCTLGPVILAHCTHERAAERTPPVVVAVRTIDAGAPPPEPSARESPDEPSTQPAGFGRSIPGDCRAAEADAKKVAESMKPSTRPIDLDGDGTPDCMFSRCITTNCRTLLYLVESGHVRLVGDLTTSFLNEPHCTASPTSAPRPDGGLCRLSVYEHMIHGEEQQYFYEYADGAYRKVGVGELTGRPRRLP